MRSRLFRLLSGLIALVLLSGGCSGDDDGPDSSDGTGGSGADRPDQAATRALQHDPWSERAYAVLVGVALARDDRSTAHRLLSRCRIMLDELGAEPSPATRQLTLLVTGVTAA